MNSSGKAENINKDIQRHSKLCCTYICLQYLLYGGFLYRKPYIFHVKELSLKAIYVWLFRAGDYTALTGFSRLSLSLRQVGQLYAALSFMAKLSSSAPQGMGRGNCKTVKNWNWHFEKSCLILIYFSMLLEVQSRTNPSPQKIRVPKSQCPFTLWLRTLWGREAGNKTLALQGKGNMRSSGRNTFIGTFV